MDSAFKTGDLIAGKYRIESRIGSGGMGEVYEAVHQVIGCRVAIKTLHAIYRNNQTIAARFQQEAQAAGSIGHDNICDIIDVGTTNSGAPYIVMPLLKGVSLRVLLNPKEPLPAQRAIYLSTQILAALDATHKRQIIHRDLKPENIFLISVGTHGDFVKLLDFGISKVITSDTDPCITHPGFIPGTPHYMAPEQVIFYENVDHRTDLYAVGVLLYEMTTGRRPFAGDTKSEVLRSVLYDPIPLPSSSVSAISIELEQIILKAMARDPEQRFGSAAEMRQTLLELEEKGTIAGDGRAAFLSTAVSQDTPFTATSGERDDIGTPKKKKTSWYLASAVFVFCMVVLFVALDIVGMIRLQNNETDPPIAHSSMMKAEAYSTKGMATMAPNQTVDTSNREGGPKVRPIHFVSLFEADKAYCIGTGLLIAPRLVLTAGHLGIDECTDPSRGPRLAGTERNVRVMIESPNAMTERIAASSEIDHPNYGRRNPKVWSDPGCKTGYGVDLGIWVLDKPVTAALPYMKLGPPQSGNAVAVNEHLTRIAFDTSGNSLVRETRTVVHTTSNAYQSEAGANGGVRFATIPLQQKDEARTATTGDSSTAGGLYFNSRGEIVGVEIGADRHSGTRFVQEIVPYWGWFNDVIEAYKAALKFGDFDGDGMADLLYWNAQRKGSWIDLSQNGQPDGNKDVYIGRWCKEELIIGDFNGDGKDDLLCHRRKDGKMWIDYSEEGVFNGTNATINTGHCRHELYVGDFDGDGWDDVFCGGKHRKRSMSINSKQPQHPFDSWDWQSNDGWCDSTTTLFIGEFTGDRSDDLLCFQKGVQMSLKQSTGFGEFAAAPKKRLTNWCENGIVYIANLNNDKKSDIFCWWPEGNGMQIDFADTTDPEFPFNGADWTSVNRWCNESIGHIPALSDANGDGRDDLYCYDNDTGKLWVNQFESPNFFNYSSDYSIPEIAYF